MSQRCLHGRMGRLGELEKKECLELFETAWEEEGAAGRDTNDGIDTEVRSVICALAVELFTCLGDVPSYSSFSGDDGRPSPLWFYGYPKVCLLKGFVGFGV